MAHHSPFSRRLIGGGKFLFPVLFGLTVLAAAHAAEITAPDAAPIEPKETIALFNGKDLSGFYTWLSTSGHEDPDHVFTVVDQIDGAPAIRISGQGYGGIVTRANYANYTLIAEFRWGQLTWGKRKDRARDAGILLHCQGEDGNNLPDFKSPWIRSIEYQLIEGGTGDLLLVGGYDRGVKEPVLPRLTLRVTPGTKVWNPDGPETEFNRGRIDWNGRDPQWKDKLNFRGAVDVEKPVGEWNRIEIICREGDLTYFLNGVKVNEGKNGSLRQGRILFQTEGAELYFRRIELHPLGK